MRWFKRRKKSDVKDDALAWINELYLWVTEASLLSADDIKQRWEEISTDKNPLDDTSTYKAMFEYFYFYYNIVDRIVFENLGQKWRDALVDLAYDLGAYPLVTSIFPTATGDEKGRFALGIMEDFDRAVEQYGKCKVLFPDASITMTDVVAQDELGGGISDNLANTSILALNLQNALGTPVHLGKLVGLIYVILENHFDLDSLEQRIQSFEKIRAGASC